VVGFYEHRLWWITLADHDRAKRSINIVRTSILLTHSTQHSLNELVGCWCAQYWCFFWHDHDLL